MGKGVAICLLAIFASVHAQFQWGLPQWGQQKPAEHDFADSYSSYSSLFDKFSKPKETPVVAASPPEAAAEKESPATDNAAGPPEAAASDSAAFEARIRSIIADELSKWNEAPAAAAKSQDEPAGWGKKGWMPPWLAGSWGSGSSSGSSSLWDFIRQKKAEKSAAISGVAVESGATAETIYPSQIAKSKKD